MTAITSVGREDVIRILGGRADRSTDPVARTALARGSLENRVGVTRLARQVAVLAQQLESGREVVERIPGLGGECRPDEHQCQ
jgi:hypothetical protein